MKCAIFFHRFGPYHTARLQSAARHFEITGIEISAQTTEYDWATVESGEGFGRVTLTDRDADLPTGELVARTCATLDRLDPEVIGATGWEFPSNLAAIRWATEKGRTAIMLSESQAIDAPRSAWKEYVKRRILRHCQGGLVGGRRHRDYLVRLGMEAGTIALGYDVVDDRYFEKAAEAARAEAAERREREGLPARYFLASARFIPKKNLPLLVECYHDYASAAADPWHLVLLGDGPERAEVEARIKSLALEDRVHLPGFRQYQDLPTYYALASAFVHPSTVEQWGLVVNEALACGLPVLVSERCGCAPELVREGENGHTFDPLDRTALTAHLRTMAELPANKREAMGTRSREVSREWSAERFGDGLAEAVEAARKQRVRPMGTADRLLFGLLLR